MRLNQAVWIVQEVQTLSESAAVLRHMYSAYLILFSYDVTCLSGDAASKGSIFNPMNDM